MPLGLSKNIHIATHQFFCSLINKSPHSVSDALMLTHLRVRPSYSLVNQQTPIYLFITYTQMNILTSRHILFITYTQVSNINLTTHRTATRHP